jgi:hypothetical protein
MHRFKLGADMTVGYLSRRRGVPGGALLALVALLGACAATPPSITTPRVEIVTLSALPSTGGRQHFRIGLLIDNQNTEPLAIAEVRFTVRLAGEGQIQATSQPVTIEALTRETIRVDADSDIISSVSRLLAVVQGPRNTLPYEMFGNVVLDQALQNSLPFNFSGEVPFSMAAE